MLPILLGIVLAGVTVNAVQAARDARRYPAPGVRIDVGGRRLHLHCEGQGQPTVILDAGLGGWSVHMRGLQQRLRDSVRTCAYDRAGLGWSDESQAHDVVAAVEDLRALVRAQQLAPVVLVGHSFGASVAQVYAAQHGGEVAGVVLIDPGTSAEMLEDLAGDTAAALRAGGCGWKCPMASSAAHLGLVRLGAMKAGSRLMTEDQNRAYRAGMARPRTLRTILRTLAAMPRTGVAVANATQFGDVPVTVLYSEELPQPGKDETAADVAAWRGGWLERMRVLLAGSSRPRGPTLVPGTTHLSVVLDPAAQSQVAAEILMRARGSR